MVLAARKSPFDTIPSSATKRTSLMSRARRLEGGNTIYILHAGVVFAASVRDTLCFRSANRRPAETLALGRTQSLAGRRVPQ